MKRTASAKIVRLLPAKQRRLDLLLDKNADGVISARERAELVKLVAEAEQLMAANARRVRRMSLDSAKPMKTAVPVTVWVQPDKDSD